MHAFFPLSILSVLVYHPTRLPLTRCTLGYGNARIVVLVFRRRGSSRGSDSWGCQRCPRDGRRQRAFILRGRGCRRSFSDLCFELFVGLRRFADGRRVVNGRVCACGTGWNVHELVEGEHTGLAALPSWRQGDQDLGIGDGRERESQTYLSGLRETRVVYMRQSAQLIGAGRN